MSNVSTCSVTQAGTKNVSATFSFFVATSKVGDGTGTVTPSPAGVSCGTGCFTYSPGQAVTISETPGSGSAFGGCDGDCFFRGTNASCPLTVTENKVVIAGFFKPVTLLVQKLGSGNGSVTSSPAGINCGTDCMEKYTFGTLVTLSASATAGSAFTGFTGCDSTVNASCRVTMNGNRTVTAAFALNGTLNVLVSGNGSVTSSPPGINCGATCSQAFTGGTVVTLLANAFVGSTFQGWAGGGCTGTGACVITINGNANVSAPFSALMGTIHTAFNDAADSFSVRGATFFPASSSATAVFGGWNFGRRRPTA